MMNNIFFQYLQKWTPFSILTIIASSCCGFIAIWDIIHGTTVQPWVVGLLSVLIGSTGTVATITHGVVVANGVANETAKNVVSEAVKQGLTGGDSEKV